MKSVLPLRPRNVLATLLLASLAVPAAGADFVTPSFELRLRHEQVDDAAFAREAEATTLRARLGFRFALAEQFSALVEAEHTGSLLGQRFNSTANGATAYPVVADPDNTELNQAWLRWAPREGSSATLGRQRLIFDNARFIGNVGWRQNEQTFDALDLQHRAGPVSLRYSWLDRVQRVFGADNPLRNNARWDLDTHLLAASGKLGPGSLSAYAHWFENQSLPLSSHRNLGLRYVAKGQFGNGSGWQLALDAAQQRPYARGAALNRANYASLDGGLDWRGTRLSAGHERLGGDGRYGFATPLATLHAFNGWADRFLATPVGGLRDSWLGVGRSFAGWNAQLVWHEFRADRGGARYGQEWDASIARGFGSHWNLLLKLASFDGRGAFRDVDKLWISLEYRL
jgi:hypothetical protein